MRVYADSIYATGDFLVAPYKGSNIAPELKAFNTAMSSMRISVEWMIGTLALTVDDLHLSSFCLLLTCLPAMASPMFVAYSPVLGKVQNLWSYLTMRRRHFLHRDPLTCRFVTAVFLTNLHTCCYGSQASMYFNCPPPTLETYLAPFYEATEGQLDGIFG
jgi:hypothetical protein